jgi:hypothetical protein
MPQLIVLEKIDGTPVSWRCSDCGQNFSVRGKFTAQVRQSRITAEFKAHLEASHKAEVSADCMAFAAGVPLPD